MGVAPRATVANPLEVALDLAALGLPVFPCGHAKKPSIAKKDGGNGFHDAVSEAGAVRALFKRARAYLVGVPTGEVSGFDVLDFDYRAGAMTWENEHRDKLPRTRAHQTQSGGRHLLFKHAPGVRNLASKFAPGMDVRGTGGYIIMPPSTGYSVIDNAEIAEWPDWLLAIVLKQKEAPRPPPTTPPIPRDSQQFKAYIDKVLSRVRDAADGAKHFTLRNAALTLGGLQHQSGQSDSEILNDLLHALPKSVTDWEAAKATIRWGVDHGKARPITLEERSPSTNGHAPPRPNGAAGYAAEPQEAPARGRRNFDGLDTDEPLQPDKQPQRPRILVLAGYRHRAADAGIAAMMAAGTPFYQRDRILVHAATTKAKTSAGKIIEVSSIVPVTIPLLARALGLAADWERANKDGEIFRMDPPEEVVKQIFAMSGEWPFPPLAGVIGTPTLRPDGSLLSKPGYDEATGLVLMSPPKMPPISEKPTKDQAVACLKLLDDLLAEFPFADAPSRSVALSMMLTVVLRGALPPAVPMHLVSAPQAGTGKSYLLDTAAAIATGERCPVIAFAPDQAETEKRLISAAIAGFPIIAIDNINDVLTGDFLAQVTERPVLQVRPLGGSTIVRLTNTYTVFANGNNIASTADMVRRTLRSGLDSDLENPEDQEFKGDPVGTVLADRGKYVAACLTVALAYISAGSPDKCKRLPSYPAWSDLPRSALVWLGKPDPVLSMATAREEDPAREARSAVFAAWHGGVPHKDAGYSTAELVGMAEAKLMNELVRPSLRAAFMRVAADKTGSGISPERLGKWLRKASNIRVGSWKLTINREDIYRPKWLMETRDKEEIC